MLKLVDLARRSDFAVGPLRVSPSRRQVEGPAGCVQLEPLVMKVLLMLLDARGGVVTRDELFGNVWGGVFVGDDSLNRTIGRLRKLAAQTAPGSFEIETIPRTGYRLTGTIFSAVGSGTEPGEHLLLRRRTILAAGCAGTLAVAAGSTLWKFESQRDRKRARANSLVDRADQILRFDFPNTNRDAVNALREAIAINPADGRAFGLLAYALASGGEDEPINQSPEQMSQIEDSIRHALTIDPHNSNALLARFIVERSLRDWIPADQDLRILLRADPRNLFAMDMLMAMLQAAGLNRESMMWNERHISLDPLSPGPQFRRALKYWIAGHVADADMTADQALLKWPTHPLVWNARFIIYAFTGRVHAALAMLEGARRPPALSPVVIQTWRISLRALDHPTPTNIAAARTINLANAGKASILSAYGVMIMSQLRQIDAADEIASGFLLGRGPLVPQAATISNSFSHSPGWRMTQWLFTPPLAAFRSDPRFEKLCEGIGLTEYWRWRGVQPDYQLAP